MALKERPSVADFIRVDPHFRDDPRPILIELYRSWVKPDVDD